MHKIIIQPGRYRGLYEIILLKRFCFLTIKGWHKVARHELQDETARALFHEIRRDLQIPKVNAFDWTDTTFTPAYSFTTPAAAH